ncbi:MAG: Uncharacterized protein G01um101416_821 [Microgenomates group bacterium Gr01-1014_16]|nr:MAG: Uncharacterized protein G01um101416_821 [Microgenomates group bacterium Gr01-1014_16]
MKRGFTLIELLMVVAILSALAVTVFVALNPAQRLKDANDARRANDVGSILSAIHTSIVDNKGNTPVSWPPTNVERQLGVAATGCTISTGGCTVTDATCANLMANGRNLGAYLASMPTDPLYDAAATLSAQATGYSIKVDSNGIVTIRACGTQGTTNIFSSR